jgi:hypothetical protein
MLDKHQEDNLKEIRSFILKGMSYQRGSLLIISIANILVDGLSNDEIDVLSNFLQSVGQIMSYIVSQKDLNDDK